MQLKEFNILLDIKKHNKIDYIEVVAGDSFSNVLNISLIDGIYPYDLTNTSVEIVFSKPDGTTVQQTDIAVINSAQGRIQCILKTNTIAAPGKVVAEVRILEGETLLTSTRFEFYVRKSLINDETVESSNEFGALQQVVLDYIAAIQRVNEIEQQVPDEVVNNLNTLTTYVNGLAGVGRTNETVKKNADDLAAHKAELASDVDGVHGIKMKELDISNSLLNNWEIYNSNYPLFARRIGDIVIINGVLKNGVLALGTNIAIINDSDFRPSQIIQCPVFLANGKVALASIKPNGSIAISNAAWDSSTEYTINVSYSTGG